MLWVCAQPPRLCDVTESRSSCRREARGERAVRHNCRVSDDELWDLRDVHGDLIGGTRRRGAMDWPSGAFHSVAGTCVVRDDGLVLVTLRAASKDHPLTWEFPAGSALAGETSLTPHADATTVGRAHTALFLVLLVGFPPVALLAGVGVAPAFGWILAIASIVPFACMVWFLIAAAPVPARGGSPEIRIGWPDRVCVLAYLAWVVLAAIGVLTA